jgi:hypothetical protein
VPNEEEQPRRLSLEELEALVVSHERALFGWKDPMALKYIPGLLARVDELPTKRLMWIWNGVIVAFFLVIIFKQYSVIPALIGAFAK